jgi:hypothetical protein
MYDTVLEVYVTERTREAEDAAGVSTGIGFRIGGEAGKE